MQVWIDMAACEGCASCVVAAPTVFDYDDDLGKATVLTEHPGPELHAQVRTAALHCPVLAVGIDENG